MVYKEKRFFQNRKKKIAKDRFTFFFYEIALVFVFLFVLLIVPVSLIPLIAEEGSILYGILFYLIRAIIILLGIPLILYLTNLLFGSQKKIILDEDISPSIGHLKMFKMTKKNYKYQFLYGFLLFFLVFLPIDFFTNLLVPEMLEYQAWAVSFTSTNSYLLADNYLIFLISVIIIQVSVAVTEEIISRGFLTKRGSVYFFKMSAVIISSLYFGLGHFAYFLNPISQFYPYWFPFVWFSQAFFIGIILALLVLRKKWIFPAIIAHALNNFVAAHAFWGFIRGIDFQIITLYLYYPLLIIGIMLLVWNYTKIKEGILTGYKVLKTYFRKDAEEDTKGDIIFRIFIDILLGGLIFLMGFLIAI